MNNVLTRQDWDECLQQVETQNLAQWIYQNISSLEAEAPNSYLYDQDGAYKSYCFLKGLLLPELQITLETLHPESPIYHFLSKVASMISVDFTDSESWLKVSETLREHCRCRDRNFQIDINAFITNVFPSFGANSPNQPANEYYGYVAVHSDQNVQVLPGVMESNGYMSMSPPKSYGVSANPVTLPNDYVRPSNPGLSNYMLAANPGSNGFMPTTNVCSNANTYIDISYMIPDSTTGDEPMEQEVSLSSSSFDQAHNSNYVQLDPRPKPVASTSDADEYVQVSVPQPIPGLPDFSASCGSNPKTIEEINQLIEIFATGLKQWKSNEELKEQDVVPGIKGQNENLLNQLENLSGTIVGSILKLLPKQPKLQQTLEDFMQNLLVVTQQPQQRIANNKTEFIPKQRVITYKTKFVSKLRILLSPKFFTKLGIVSVILLNQENEDALNNNAKHTSKDKNKDKKIHSNDKKSCVISENRIELKMIIPVKPSRLDKSDGTTVLDEFFWLSFKVKLSLQVKGFLKKPMEITIPATSFPIKVIVHASQEFRAWESVIWGNASGQFDVYKISDRKSALPFIRICKAINSWFQRFAGRELCEEDFRCVARNLFKCPKFENMLTEMSFQEFRQEIYHEKLELEIPAGSNEPNEPKNISFWGWFWHLEKFIIKHLQIRNTTSNLWKDGKVMAYNISDSINQLLSQNLDRKLFVLRFSLGTPNGITVQFYDKHDGEITSTRFSGRELGEKLNLQLSLDCAEDWGTLYCPNGTSIRKEVIFQCDSLSQPGSTAAGTEANGGGLSRLSVVLNQCRYVFPKIRLTLQFDRS